MRGQHTYPWSDAIRMLSGAPLFLAEPLERLQKASLFVAN
jgi:hypothetical protein